MKKIIILSLFLLLLLSGCRTEENQKINNSCAKEYELYKEIVSKYKIGMEDIVQEQGCGVIPIYASVIEAEKFDILDEIDKNPDVMRRLVKLFTVNEKFSSLIFQNTTVKKIILSNVFNDNFIEKFTYLTKKKLHKKELREIEKDTNYLNYALLASIYAKDKKESKRLYTELKSSISIELMPSFGLILNSIGDEYTFEELLENFTILTKELSIDEVKELAVYPQYFAYFLYPKKETLGIDIISFSKLREIQKSIQKKVIYIYQEMFEKYRYEKGFSQIDYALLTVENIYPYLLEQYRVDDDRFKKLFHHLVRKDYIISLFHESKCSKTTNENFAVFGQNNIENAVKLLRKEKHFVSTLFSEFQDSNYSVISFFYVANLYENLDIEEWKIFKELLTTLPYDYDNKITFIQKIEKAGYFRNIVVQSDYTKYIDSLYGNSNPKYKYILLTPYPSQDDMNLLDTVLKTNISDDVLQRSLVDLIAKNREELETHEFTKSEKFFGNIDTLSNVATFVSIGLVPFTGGISLSYIAVVTAKQASQKGAKYMMRKIAIHSRKAFNKGIGKARVVRKQLDNKIGINNRNKLRTSTDKIDNGLDVLAISGSAIIYFNSNNLKIKKICEE